MAENQQKPSESEACDLDTLSERISKARRDAGLQVEAPSEEDATRSSIKLSHIGIDFLATVLSSFGIGWLIDEQFGTRPWGMLLLLLGGIAVGFTNVWLVLNGFAPTLQWRKKSAEKK